LSEKVLAAVTSAGYLTPTPIQEQAIPHVLARRDVLGIAQTGTGKTAAFVLPMLTKLEQGRARARMPRTLILEPTRELAAQVEEHFGRYGANHKLNVALLIGGVSYDDQDSKLVRGVDVLIATPGRLLDHCERGRLLMSGVELLVIDEADRMLDMGFLPAIKRIVSILPKERQTMCFSATMEGDMARIVKDYLRNAVRLSFGSTSKPSENVRVQAFEVAMDRKQEMLQRLLTKEKGKCLVFARTKRGTERIAESLNRKGFSAAMIHGDRSQSQRTSALAGFQQGRFRVLVATDLASRGIHVQDIAHVINYDLPEVAENFIHRVGRTGRNGGHGVASTLFVKEQRSELFHLERSLGIKIERMRADETGSLPEKQERRPVNLPTAQDHRPINLPRAESGQVPERFVLPGEVFQTHMEN
jgi:superfamily II DNA/RNA helicase